MKKRTSWAAMALLLLLLAACGGGGESTVTATNPAPPAAAAPATPAASVPSSAASTPVAVNTAAKPVAPVAPADATLTQLPQEIVVSPGETFRLAVLQVTCPQDAFGNCKQDVMLGETKLSTSVDVPLLQDIKLRRDGETIATMVRSVNGDFYLDPLGYFSLYRPGNMEVFATLSAAAPEGTAMATVHVVGANVDKMLVMVSAPTKIRVIALPQYAPAKITSIIDGKGRTIGLGYECGPDVVGGCALNASANVTGEQQNLSLTVITVDGNGGKNGFDVITDALGSTAFGSGLWVPQGSTGAITVNGLTTGNVQFSNFMSYSGEKKIEPLMPVGCTTNTFDTKACKG